MKQVNTTVCLGMGATGEKRLKLYRQGIRIRGYKSLSGYIVNLVDSQLEVDIPQGPRHKNNNVHERVH